MKKVLVLLLALTLTFSMSFSVLAAPDKAKNDKGKTSSESTVKSEKSLLKTFKQEIKQEKKSITAQKSDCEIQLLDLQARYDELIASTPVDENAAAQKELDLADLKAQITAQEADLVGMQTEMKKIINERYMLTKSMYNADQLAGFENAGALIEQMYADASVIDAWSVTVHNNLVKFEAPAYIKSGKIMFPLKAIADSLGAECTYFVDPITNMPSVSITKDGTTMVFDINSAIATITQTLPVETTEEDAVVEETAVDETATDVTVVEEDVTETVTTHIDMLVPANITCGRAYVPLQELAEIFGLEVIWDEENEIIDIEEEPTEDIDDGITEDITTPDII